MSIRSEILSEIPTVILPENITSVRLIEGGFNNTNILINENYLIKEYQQQDESNDPVYERFIREKETLKLLEHNPHSPRLLNYYDKPPKLYISREWIAGSHLSLEKVHSLADRIIKAILSFHKFRNSTSGDFRYLDVISRYLREYKKILLGHSSKTDEFRTLPQYQTLIRYYKDQLIHLKEHESPKNIVRLHGDLVLSNIILSPNEEKLFFIDWEYSTLGNPLIDLAYLLTQNQIPKITKNKLLDCFCEQRGLDLDETELSIFCDLMTLMSALWYSIHAYRLKFNFSNHSNSISSVAGSLKLANINFKSLKLAKNEK
ncbi:MAG: phosphotransferase [Candidatus Hodarchaeota archaeon]